MNSVMLSGRLTRDPQIKSTQKGTKVASYSIAVQRNKDEADFINCISWDKQADIVDKYCHKGDFVIIEGRLSTRSYDAQDGYKVYVTEVISNRVELTPRPKQEPKEEYPYSLTAEAEKDVSYSDLPF